MTTNEQDLPQELQHLAIPIQPINNNGKRVIRFRTNFTNTVKLFIV